MKNNKLYKSIRKICEANGWEVWNTYSDKRKKVQRVKFMRGGSWVPTAQKERIVAECARLKAPKGTTISFERRELVFHSQEQTYDALILRIPRK